MTTPRPATSPRWTGCSVADPSVRRDDSRARRPPWWALVSAIAAPVVVVGAWTVAAAVQPAGYDAVHDTISALARHGAAHRLIMTAGLALLGVAHLVTAAGLRALTPISRTVLGTAGLATLGVAAFAQPDRGSSAPHIALATVGFVLLALWPASTALRRSDRQPFGCAYAGGRSGGDGGVRRPAGLVRADTARRARRVAERLVVVQQALWPLVVVLALRLDGSASDREPHAGRRRRVAAQAVHGLTRRSGRRGDNGAVTDRRDIVLLGSTGSIGTQAIDVVAAAPERFRVVALARGRRRRRPAGRAGRPAAGARRRRQPRGRASTSCASGWTRCGRPTCAPRSVHAGRGATERARRARLRRRAQRRRRLAGPARDPGRARGRHGVALANKESLIAGGPLVTRRAGPGQLRPRRLRALGAGAVPARGHAPARCAGCCSPPAAARSAAAAAPSWPTSRPQQALAHPTWDMGRLVTTNSATLVNKGLEVIEAHLLFGVPYDRIDVVVHPQSVDPLDGRVHRRLDASPRRRRRTCGCRSRWRSAGPTGCPVPRRRSTGRRRSSGRSSRWTTTRSPPSRSRAGPARRAAARRRSTTPPTRNSSTRSTSGRIGLPADRRHRRRRARGVAERTPRERRATRVPSRTSNSAEAWARGTSRARGAHRRSGSRPDDRQEDEDGRCRPGCCTRSAC